MTHLSIDADGLIYRCGFAAEKTKYLVTDVEGSRRAIFDTKKEASAEVAGLDGLIWSRKEIEPLENALHLVKQTLENLPEHDSRTLWLTPAIGNFRERIAVTSKYKGNRDLAARPVHYRDITTYLISKHGARYTVGQEADDAIGIEATKIGDSCCIVSFDKDLDQIPGPHYNWVTKDLYSVGRKDAAINFYLQILSGDAVDNIRGIEGIGPATARKILGVPASPAEAWKKCVEAYTERYGEEGLTLALETARLVYVRRKEGEIWEPPTEEGGT